MPVERRLIERRQARGVGCVHIQIEFRAELEQRVERPRLFFHDREVQRPPAAIGAVHLPIQLRAIAAHDRADSRDVADCDRRQDVVARAVREQVVDDLRIRFAEHAQPAHHLEVVAVVRADGVGAVVYQ